MKRLVMFCGGLLVLSSSWAAKTPTFTPCEILHRMLGMPWVAPSGLPKHKGTVGNYIKITYSETDHFTDRFLYRLGYDCDGLGQWLDDCRMRTTILGTCTNSGNTAIATLNNREGPGSITLSIDTSNLHGIIATGSLPHQQSTLNISTTFQRVSIGAPA